MRFLKKTFDWEDDKNHGNILKELNSHTRGFHDQFFVLEEGKIISETKVLQSR
jgi:hypothetical protein